MSFRVIGMGGRVEGSVSAATRASLQHADVRGASVFLWSRCAAGPSRPTRSTCPSSTSARCDASDSLPYLSEIDQPHVLCPVSTPPCSRSELLMPCWLLCLCRAVLAVATTSCTCVPWTRRATGTTCSSRAATCTRGTTRTRSTGRCCSGAGARPSPSSSSCTCKAQAGAYTRGRACKSYRNWFISAGLQYCARHPHALRRQLTHMWHCLSCVQ